MTKRWQIDPEGMSANKITVASVTPKDDEGKKFANANFLFVPRACPGSSNLGLGKRRGDPSPKVQK